VATAGTVYYIGPDRRYTLDVHRYDARKIEMTMRSRYASVPGLAALLAACLFVSADTLAAENEGRKPYPELAYLHGAIGVGIAVLNSSDVQNYIDDKLGLNYDITNVGVDFAYSLRFGVRNLAQFEYRLERGVGHKLFYDGGSLNSSEIEMDVDSDEWLVKGNPFFALYDDPSVSTFLVFGKGTAEYLDPLGEGFSDGTKTIFGLEITKMYNYYGFSVSVERHSLTFDRAVIGGELDTSRSWDASWWIIQGSLSAGIGL
jgi:hypothetical protein